MEPPPKPSPLLSDHAAERDLLDFSPYSDALADVISDPASEGPLVIGLFGTWGSGKTSLMQFVRDHPREEKSKDGKGRFRLTWFDAWKYEKEDALWRALLLRVVDSLRDRDDPRAGLRWDRQPGSSVGREEVLPLWRRRRKESCAASPVWPAARRALARTRPDGRSLETRHHRASTTRD
jgi:hypothetical protein